MNNQEELIENLNDLLTRNYDAEAGYKQAAEKVENKDLKGYLEARAKARYDFGHELKAQIKGLGGDPEKGTSLVGDAHRVWIGLKDALSSGDQALYEEAVRGEKAFIGEYQKVLKDQEHLPETIVNLIQTHLSNAQSALKELEALKGFSN